MDQSSEEAADTEVFWVEELDSNDIPETELSQFTEALEVVGVINDENGCEAEPELIKKFVRGEVEFPELFTKLQSDDESENEDTDEKEEDIENEQPTTSAKAAAAMARRASKATRKKNMLDDDDIKTTGRSRTGGSGGGGGGRKRTVLSPALQGLMGEANLSYARGQLDMAEKLCLEIIRQNPLASEPFLTLAEIYETRDREKHLNFLTIAAHLNPHDRDQWIRIAEMYIAKGNFARARIYYSKAIKALSKDYDLRLRKARLLEKMNDQLGAMLAYLRMIPHCPVEQSDFCMHTAKKVAAYFHQNGKYALACEAMENAYGVCAHLFSMEDLNLYMDLLILNKQYSKVLKCLRERTYLTWESEDDNDTEVIIFLQIPEDFLPEFRAKVCVSLIKLGVYHLLGYLVQNVQEYISPTEEHLNLYIDIVEALMQEEKYEEAIELLRPVTECNQLESCPAFVWLRQAECLRQLNRNNEAIDSYQRVVATAPYCYEAKFTLAALLKQKGRYEEAVKALEPCEENSEQPLHSRLLYERVMLLQQMGVVDEYIAAGCDFLGRRSLQLLNREELIAIAGSASLYHYDGLKTILQNRNMGKEPIDKYIFNRTVYKDIEDMTIEDEYNLFLELVMLGFRHKKFSSLERLCFAMVTTKRFIDFHHDLERIVILICYFNNDCSVAFSYLRDMITKNPSNVSFWNMLGLLFQRGPEVRYYRYLRRVADRRAGMQRARIFLAHYAFNCSSHKIALNIYTQLYKTEQTPLLALCISVGFNQLCMHKRVVGRTAAVGQAITFAEKYASLRRLECSNDKDQAKKESSNEMEVAQNDIVEQEICYNIGRIYHQAGLPHLAVEYYERALRTEHPFIALHSKYLDLKPEIAYNLHLIYRASGNLRKARQYLYDYCVV